ncbi:Hypothetical predicted protein [Pelobates cultripes]|uniref:Uncharacterized protein n=1 Tax=Pelobates cultripes TaxID=61616 RepID=A0AAD1WNV4_PELCU|nr:Hypothetical predicted protein [Pelobates cultripes]
MVGGAQDNYRPYSKLRTKIRKPTFQTIDASSGDSTSDLETSEDLKRQTSDPFLEKDRYSDEPPGTSRINTRDIKKTTYAARTEALSKIQISPQNHPE